MPNKDQEQQNSIKYSIWNTNTNGINLEHDLISRTKSFKSSLNHLGQAAREENQDE